MTDLCGFLLDGRNPAKFMLRRENSNDLHLSLGFVFQGAEVSAGTMSYKFLEVNGNPSESSGCELQLTTRGASSEQVSDAHVAA